MVPRQSYMVGVNPRASRTMIEQSKSPAKSPRSEPEIIPPGHIDERSAGSAHAYFQVRGTRHVYVGNLGPIGIILLALVIAIFAAVILVVLLGAVLIWIPFVALLVAAGVISGLLRRSFVRRAR
jgi:hypothetical protein